MSHLVPFYQAFRASTGLGVPAKPIRSHVVGWQFGWQIRKGRSISIRMTIEELMQALERAWSSPRRDSRRRLATPCCASSGAVYSMKRSLAGGSAGSRACNWSAALLMPVGVLPDVADELALCVPDGPVDSAIANLGLRPQQRRQLLQEWSARALIQRTGRLIDVGHLLVRKRNKSRCCHEAPLGGNVAASRNFQGAFSTGPFLFSSWPARRLNRG